MKVPLADSAVAGKLEIETNITGIDNRDGSETSCPVNGLMFAGKLSGP